MEHLPMLQEAVNAFMSASTRLVRGDFLLQLGPDVFDFAVGKMFNADEFVSGVLSGANEFIELGLDGRGVAVLGILDQEYHKERGYRRSGVHNELPRVGPVEEWSAKPPHRDHGASKHKGGRLPGSECGSRCK
jgi:hypothetical protein